MDSVYSTVYYGTVLVAGVAFILGLVLYIFQDKLIYQPNPMAINSPTPDSNPHPYRSPGDRGIPFDTVSLTTADGVKLHGWLMKSEHKSSPLIVYFQANAGNMGFRMDIFERLVKQSRVSILAVSYRGYGFSEGTPSEPGLMLDADATIKFAFESSYASNGVFLMGASLGGAVSIYAASKNKKLPIKGVILENTFTSLPQLVDVIMPAVAFLKSFVLRNYWPSITRIKDITAPILFIAGKKDELVPHNHMIALMTAASSTPFKDWFEVEDGEHNTTWMVAGESYQLRVRQFVERCLAA